jgi:hypothetical protein
MLSPMLELRKLLRGGGAEKREVAVRELYLDLLIKTLANTVYGDPPIGPGHTQFDPTVRETGLDWPAQAHTMVGLARLRNLRELVQRTIDENIHGDYIETGVWRGGCCILMRGVLAANGVANRKVYVADSFSGLPPPNPDRYPADAGDTHYTFRQLAVPLDEVRANFATYGLLDSNVVFVPGLFQDTLPNINATPFALIRLDGDMYESTIVTLTNLYPRLSQRGFVIIDDYGAIEACRKAVTDYRHDNGISAEIHVVDWTGAWWQKS